MLAYVCVVVMSAVPRAAAMKMPSACSACELAIGSLQERLENEKMGEKTIDLRNRLDPHGQRQGKTIEYKDSETRIEALTGELCAEEFKDVSFVQSDAHATTNGSTTSVWKSVSSQARKGKNKAYHEKQQRKFEGYCAFLFDEYEEEFARLIRGFEKGKGMSVTDAFCIDFLKVCTRADAAVNAEL